ncbi:hypothetical protein BCR41DRAFT_385246 [Lobosporangium transversale]|uniref:RING-type domain-containing protein n=1 Tax=Lobosporangium transversale TaxID=64571 RepID=A0A1Y2GSQ4_9FUNG|nr:hypothetical protein BCR41DRAFT_385246 [Lobosporangium transversale]ORZ21810.1 hypothetical protein BCR41DRAFT_385246 [Lobosporangium transversale]|eukprot:XP_021883061.1 hypothetical protein BCR41DRAFT_385246 [Lobosporangium transversale]
MSCSKLPPIFTNYGYQPSIFLDVYPTSMSSLNRYRPQVSDYAHSISSEESATNYRVDYIQIWLNSHRNEVALETCPGLRSSSSPAVVLERADSQDISSVAPPSNSDSSNSSMEWTSCLSSPTTTQHILCVDNVQEMSLESTKSKNTTISFAHQHYPMFPLLPFRGRGRCMFLAPEISNAIGVYHHIKDLLQNASIQRIRAWLKTTIEPYALEQWRNVSYLNYLKSLVPISTSRSVDRDIDEAQSNPNSCPICFRSGTIMKRIIGCQHLICWKCEQALDLAGNISCPICRGMRFSSSYVNVLDMFKTTVGLYNSDYTHSRCPAPTQPSRAHNVDYNEIDDDEELEHEMTDRYLWEQSHSFLEYAHALSTTSQHPYLQYFQLNAAQDLCFKSSAEEHLPEYNDQVVLEPPISGVVLPPHRLYIVLIHFCLDMLTLPNPAEFQLHRPSKYRHEILLIELVILFLVPTDEFSPREPKRIYNAVAWIEHGQFILARIHRFLKAKNESEK